MSSISLEKKGPKNIAANKLKMCISRIQISTLLCIASWLGSQGMCQNPVWWHEEVVSLQGISIVKTPYNLFRSSKQTCACFIESFSRGLFCFSLVLSHQSRDFFMCCSFNSWTTLHSIMSIVVDKWRSQDKNDKQVLEPKLLCSFASPELKSFTTAIKFLKNSEELRVWDVFQYLFRSFKLQTFHSTAAAATMISYIMAQLLTERQRRKTTRSTSHTAAKASDLVSTACGQ